MTRLLTLAVMVATLPATAAAQESPSFTKHIKPILNKYCLECHGKNKPKAEFDVSTYQALKKGGISFPGFIPGKPDDSFMLILVEHRSMPVMPPKRKNQPTKAEKLLLRKWIAAGAKNDSGTGARTLPPITPRGKPPAAVTALAYRPDGKLLAVGSHRTIYLIQSDGKMVEQLPGQEPVTAVAFSPDGLKLAVATGQSGSAGQIHIYQMRNGKTDPKPRSIAAHKDVIYDLDYSPDGKLLASCSYDRLVKLWDTATGKIQRVLKDHSDTVYGTAFSPNGRLLATASADRAVKIWAVATGKRLYTLSDATDWVYAVAWSPDGKHVAAGGVDKSIRVWQADEAGGRLVKSAFAHSGPVTQLVYSADGRKIFSQSEDRTTKAWESGNLVELKVYAKQPDTPLALAVRPDGMQLAVGRYDGVLVLMDRSGKVQAQPLPAKPRRPTPK